MKTRLRATRRGCPNSAYRPSSRCKYVLYRNTDTDADAVAVAVSEPVLVLVLARA